MFLIFSTPFQHIKKSKKTWGLFCKKVFPNEIKINQNIKTVKITFLFFDTCLVISTDLN